MRILFWNINKQPESKIDVISGLINKTQPDLFFIAESNKKFDVEKINNDYVKISFKGKSNKKSVTAFIKKSFTLTVKEYRFDGRIALCVINNGTEELAICGVHFWSKIPNGFKQKYYSSELRNEIFYICDKHKKVAFIGDFNLAPWDEIMYSHLGFNAIPWSSQIKQHNFLFEGANKHYYIYNPMWNYLGDEIKGSTFGVKGSYSAEIDGFLQWQFFDQVLCTKELIDRIFPNKIEVIANVLLAGVDTDIMTKHSVKGKQKYKYSDHYPVFCNLN